MSVPVGRFAAALATGASAVFLLGSCAGTDSTPDATMSVSPEARQAYTKLAPTGAQSNCGPTTDVAVQDGTLTIATDKPAYSPWFFNNDPANGKGFEGAVAQQIAKRLGYSEDKIRFVTVPFAEALRPGEKTFDFDIDQFTIVDDRRAAVDMSTPYYAVAQSVVAMSGNPAAQARTLAALSGFRLGAQRGTTSLSAINGSLRPAIPAREYATNDDAKKALAAGEIDALVVDLPTGFQIAADQVPRSVLVGQFPRPNEVTEFFGAVLQKDSAMTPCVNGAIDGLYADGTLDRLAHQWLADTAGARVLD